MHIVHGTWMPDPPGEFVQTGGFYLWVETDQPIPQPRRPGTGVHPRHLANAALDTFVTERLDVRPFPLSVPARRTCAFLLPSAAGAPLPSAELLPYLETTAPADFELAWWQICCLTPEQASLYEAVVRDVAAQLDEAVGIQRRGMMLATLLKLK